MPLPGAKCARGCWCIAFGRDVARATWRGTAGVEALDTASRDIARPERSRNRLTSPRSMCLPAKLNSVPGRVYLDDSRYFPRLPMTALPGDDGKLRVQRSKKFLSFVASSQHLSTAFESAVKRHFAGVARMFDAFPAPRIFFPTERNGFAGHMTITRWSQSRRLLRDRSTRKR